MDRSLNFIQSISLKYLLLSLSVLTNSFTEFTNLGCIFSPFVVPTVRESLISILKITPSLFELDSISLFPISS
ncbi:MAG: Uncharacterised protein [Crocinitomicaceae bacterium]|nr:MAG: Uncharacterised protein [Crocinitomicaceae bacterium]